MFKLDELDFINKLTLEGPQILYKYNTNEYFNNSAEYRNIIINYEKLYFSNQLFNKKNSIQFLDYIVTDNNNSVWNNLLINSNNDEIKNYLTYIFDYVCDKSIIEQITIYNKLLKKELLESLIDNLFWNYKTGKDIEYNSFIGNLVNKINLEDNNLIEEITIITQFINNLLTNNDLHQQFLNLIQQLLQHNLITLNLDPHNKNLQYVASDTFLYKLLHIIIEIARNNITNIEIINKQNNNFQSKWFFTLLDYIRIFYVPLYQRVKELPNLKRQFSLTSMLGIFQNINYPINVINNYLEQDIVLIKYNKIHNDILEFYNLVCTWIKNIYDHSTEIDSILDIMQCCITIEDIIHSNIIDNFIDLTINIVTNTKYTKNINIRYDYLYILKMYNNYCIKKYIDRLPNALVSLYNDIDINSHLSNYDFDLCQKRRFIICNFIIIISDYIESDYWDNIDKTKLQKFINILFSDNNQILDDIHILNHYINTNNYDKSYIINSFKILREIIHNMIDIFEFYNILLKKDTFIRLFKNPILLSTFTIIINKSVQQLVNLNFNFHYQFISEKISDKNIKFYIKNIINVLLILKSDIFLQTLTYDHNIYNLNNYKELISYFKKIYPNYKTEEINTLLNTMEGLENNNKIEELYNDIPDKFIDPLGLILINNPILLPKMDDVGQDIFMERSFIEKQLLFKEENPFTRDNLTIIQLNDYNNKPNIIEKINKFKQELENWKKNNVV